MRRHTIARTTVVKAIAVAMVALPLSMASVTLPSTAQAAPMEMTDGQLDEVTGGKKGRGRGRGAGGLLRLISGLLGSTQINITNQFAIAIAINGTATVNQTALTIQLQDFIVR